MTHPNLNHLELEAMSAETAALYARKMVDLEATASGDVPGAIDRLARRYGVSRWTLDRLRKGRTKTVEVGLFGRLRAAYLAEVERQIKKLEHELAIERAMGGDDDAVERAEAAARELSKALEEKKAQGQSRSVAPYGLRGD